MAHTASFQVCPLWFTIGKIPRFRFHYLPESASVILMGIVLGYVAQKLHSSRAELDVLSFSVRMGGKVEGMWQCVDSSLN